MDSQEKSIKFFLFSAASLAVILSINLVPKIAQAHTLKTDNSIGVVLHVEPNDDPVVGQTSKFFFDMSDKDKKFSPRTCDCVVKITKNGQEVASEPASQIDDHTLGFSYIFPEKNIYTVALIGKPQQDGAFQSFEVSYDWRIERVGATTGPEGVKEYLQGHFLVSLGIVAVLVAAVGYFYTPRKPKP